MDAIVLYANTAAPKDHIERDKELEESYEHPDGQYIGWPEEEECIEHVKGADYSNNAPAHVRFPLDVK